MISDSPWISVIVSSLSLVSIASLLPIKFISRLSSLKLLRKASTFFYVEALKLLTS